MAHDLSGLMKFIETDRWCGAFEEALREHVQPACEEFGLSPAELGDYFSHEILDHLWFCAFEDFLTRETEEGLNIVDDYLKRRGQKETASNKVYIRALRNSAMSLFEIGEVEVDKGFFATDLIRGGEPVFVIERRGTHTLRPGYYLAARLVQLDAGCQMAGGVLPLSGDAVDELLETFLEVETNAADELLAFAEQERVVIPPDLLAASTSIESILRASGPLFSTAWLEHALDRAINGLPDLRNSDGDPIAVSTIRFPIKRGVRRSSLRRALSAIPTVRHEHEDRFIWLRSNEDATAATDCEFIMLGVIDIVKRTVVLDTDSAERAERGKDLLAEALGDLVGEPEVTTIAMKRETAAREELLTADPMGHA